MAEKKLGKQTIRFSNPPVILATATYCGKKENEGPLGRYFDYVISDDLFDEDTFEKAESKMFLKAVQHAIEKCSLQPKDIDLMFGGDLLNQLISSNFAARELQIPFYGLYGACSTMAESLALGAMSIDGGFADFVTAAASSHFCTAERQYRYPLELGSQRPPSAQWTVTGAAAVLLGRKGDGPKITSITTGRVMDFGITDSNNMGAAMAPAAVDTILCHFKDTGTSTEDYDLIITGDLGKIGMDITRQLLMENGYDVFDKYTDCGVEIFDAVRQDVHSGGSGCGCSGIVLGGYLYKELLNKKWKKILFLSTGALMSPTSSMQGESIPGIAHAVTIEGRM